MKTTAIQRARLNEVQRKFDKLNNVQRPARTRARRRYSGRKTWDRKQLNGNLLFIGLMVLLGIAVVVAG